MTHTLVVIHQGDLSVLDDDSTVCQVNQTVNNNTELPLLIHNTGESPQSELSPAASLHCSSRSPRLRACVASPVHGHESSRRCDRRVHRILRERCPFPFAQPIEELRHRHPPALFPRRSCLASPPASHYSLDLRSYFSGTDLLSSPESHRLRRSSARDPYRAKGNEPYLRGCLEVTCVRQCGLHAAVVGWRRILRSPRIHPHLVPEGRPEGFRVLLVRILGHRSLELAVVREFHVRVSRRQPCGGTHGGDRLAPATHRPRC